MKRSQTISKVNLTLELSFFIDKHGSTAPVWLTFISLRSFFSSAILLVLCSIWWWRLYIPIVPKKNEKEREKEDSIGKKRRNWTSSCIHCLSLILLRYLALPRSKWFPLRMLCSQNTVCLELLAEGATPLSSKQYFFQNPLPDTLESSTMNSARLDLTVQKFSKIEFNSIIYNINWWCMHDLIIWWSENDLHGANTISASY